MSRDTTHLRRPATCLGQFLAVHHTLRRVVCRAETRHTPHNQPTANMDKEPNARRRHRLNKHDWIIGAALIGTTIALALSAWNATQIHSLHEDVESSQKTQTDASTSLTVQALQWVGKLAFDQAVYGPSTSNGTLSFYPVGIFDLASGNNIDSNSGGASGCYPTAAVWTKLQNTLLIFMQSFTCDTGSATAAVNQPTTSNQPFTNISFGISSGWVPGIAPGATKCDGIALVNGATSTVTVWPSVISLDTQKLSIQFPDGRKSYDPLAIYFAVACPTV